MIYEYVCDICKEIEEINHPMTEDPVIKCDCGMPMRKIISGGSGTIFKGGGWSTGNREKLQRKEKSAKLAETAKERHHYGDYGY